MDATTPELQGQGLVVGYGDGTVIHDLDIEVRSREVVGLLGANGAGKTTILRALSGIRKPEAGIVRINGEDVTGRPPEQLVRRGLSHLPEGRGTLSDLTVEENIRVASFAGKRPARVVLESSYDRFPLLANKRQQLAGTLSGGEQQLLGLARALASEPRVLLLDEPSLGLAPKTAQEIFATLAAVVAEAEMAVLIVEQNVGLCLELADRIYLLESGRVVSTGASEEIGASDSVAKAFLGM